MPSPGKGEKGKGEGKSILGERVSSISGKGGKGGESFTSPFEERRKEVSHFVMGGEKGNRTSVSESGGRGGESCLLEREGKGFRKKKRRVGEKDLCFPVGGRKGRQALLPIRSGRRKEGEKRG